MSWYVWFVQKAMFGDEFGVDHFTAAVDATGDRRVMLDYVFWESTIDLKLTGVDPKDVIPFGTRSLVAYGMKHGWAVSWDNKFEYSSLLALGDEFINHDMTVASLDTLPVPDTGKAYIREAAGFNIIKGKVISGYAWPEWVAGLSRPDRSMDGVMPNHHDWHPIDGNTLFAYAPVKTILAEYRVWVIKGKVTTSSQYMLNGVVTYKNSDDNFEVNDYAQRIADKLPYNMENYVLDIFRTDKGLKVGEINCIHCSGWYNVDPRKVVKALASR